MTCKNLIDCVIACVLGILWPVEGMPKFLQYISYALPTTYAAEAMRSIMGRGVCMHITITLVLIGIIFKKYN